MPLDCLTLYMCTSGLSAHLRMKAEDSLAHLMAVSNRSIVEKSLAIGESFCGDAPGVQKA